MNHAREDAGLCRKEEGRIGREVHSGIRRMIRLEAVCVAAFGTLLGLVGGLLGAWKVSGLANGAIPQYSFSLPWDTLGLVVLLSLAVGAAALPARRAAALSPLEAVAEA
ncbi:MULTISPECIES: FtsX-like permease family protein [unclassified Streptomyces]|uniref:FtsX-like permease family protein n=1 Tax=unclassified Streptomyces TaxID=2593676 RepID=UPI0036BDD9E5